jgi:lysophospholipase L1-like esterase
MAREIGAANNLLFIGDSITDCNRQSDPEGLGFGYVRMLRDVLVTRRPESGVVVTNRGVSGDRVSDLQQRWQRDVIERAPDAVSIYIGVNDVWDTLPPGNPGAAVAGFIAGYRAILEATRRALPDTAIVLCEPSVVWPPAHPTLNAMLAPYVAAVRLMASQFAATAVVALHGAFELAREKRPEVEWTTDGLHPSGSGHLLIAQTWLLATGLLPAG